MTLNAKDFPRGTLYEEGLTRHDPDRLLMGFWTAEPEKVERAAARVLEAANRDGGTWEIRGLLKKARLTRLGKALSATT